MGWVGNALHGRGHHGPLSDFEMYVSRTQKEYCEHCLYVYWTTLSGIPLLLHYNHSDIAAAIGVHCLRISNPHASTSGPLAFCAICGWRHLVAKAAAHMQWSRLEVQATWSKPTTRIIVLDGVQSWCDFAIRASYTEIMQVWAAIPEAVREAVDDIDRRPLDLQLAYIKGEVKGQEVTS